MHFVLALQCLLLGHLVLSTESTGEQWTYDIHAETSVGNEKSGKGISQWILAGKLNIQSIDNQKIMKLYELKTKAYNGPDSGNIGVPEIEIPDEANILTESFIANYDNAYDRLKSVIFLPGDPLWSTNIKKGIASVFQVDYNLNDTNLVQSETHENNLYGDCVVIYKKIAESNDLTITKENNLLNCKINNAKRKRWDEIPYGYFSGHINRSYTFSKEMIHKNQFPAKITSSTVFKYSVTPSENNQHTMIQKITFKLVNSAPAEEPIDLSRHTVQKTPAYDFETKPKNVNILRDHEAMKNWIGYYTEFQKGIKRNSSEEINDENFNYIDKLVQTMQDMDIASLGKFFQNDFTTDSQMTNIYTSLVPYLGTNASLQLLGQFYKKEHNFNIVECKILALFPFHVQNPDEDLLNGMESYINYAKTTSNLDDNYLISFSNVIAKYLDNTDNEDSHSKTIVKSYIDKFHQLFLEKEDYNTRIKYLLGMGNMGTLATDILLSIIGNVSESRHVRSLATYTVKPLMRAQPDKVFNTFWPIVKNSAESFELRVAALSVVLDTQAHITDLNTIYEYLNENAEGPYQKQLYNYFYTDVLSKQKCHSCKNVDVFNSFTNQLNSPKTNKGLMSGSYLLRYSNKDNQFTYSATTRIVANPITNFVQTIQVSVLPYAENERKLNSFSLFVKVEGIAKRLFKSERPHFHTVKELYNMLKDLKVDLKEENEELHMEFIVYYEEKAVFAVFINKNNIPEMEYLINELIYFIIENNFIFMKEMTRTTFVTDLGTPVSASVNYQYYYTGAITNFDKIFMDDDDKEEEDNFIGIRIKSNWKSKMNFMSMNPLTNISHGVSKIFSTQQYVNLRLEYDLYDFSIQWKDNDVYIDYLTDFKTAVYVDKDKGLEKYCSQCKNIYFYPKNTHKLTQNYNIWALIKNISIIDNKCDILIKKKFSNIMSDVQITNTGNPLFQPVALLAYFFDYNYYLIPRDNCQLSIRTDSIKSAPNRFKAKVRMDVDPASRINKFNMNFNGTITLLQHDLSNNNVINEYMLNIIWYQLATIDNYEIHYSDINNAIAVNLHSKLNLKPSPNHDMFSIKPSQPITSKTSILYEKNDITPTQIDISTIVSVTNKKQELVMKSENYKNCEKDSIARNYNILQFAAPTKSCYDTSEDIASYDNYVLNIDIKNPSNDITYVINKYLLSKDDEEEDTKNYNISLIYSALNGQTSFNVNDNQLISKWEIPEKYLPRIFLQHTDILINKIKYKTYGLESVCIITPDSVQTFTEDTVDYEMATTMLSLIECTNSTSIALVTMREHSRVRAKLWYDDYIFNIGTRTREGYDVLVNDKKLRRNIKNDDYKAEFFKDGSFLLTVDKVELYYNEKHISVKMKSIYINEMCGICASGNVLAPNVYH